MGSSDSKSDMVNYGKWEKEKPCCVNRTQQYITEIIWASCPLTNEDVEFLVTIGRLSTLLLSEIFLKGQSLSHDFIEAHVECKIHKKKFCYTLDYGCDGRHMDAGKYNKKYDTYKSFKPEYLSLGELEEVFDKCINGFEPSDYDFLNRNCKSYAEDVYKNLEQYEEHLRNKDYKDDEYCWINSKDLFGLPFSGNF
jgi:hypothetical protein